MMRKKLTVCIVLITVLMLLAGCKGNAPTTTAPEAPAQVQQDAVVEGTKEETTLIVWDVMNRPEESAILDVVIANFEAAHPGVKIARESKNLDDLKVTSALALGSQDGPDVVQVNQGESDMGAMVKAGLLLPLDVYAAKYGWLDTFAEGLAALNSWSDDGAHMGEGNLYGLPLQAEIVGVYYRKDIFKQYGLSIPKTYAEFEAVMAKLAEAGIVPLVYGNLDGWPAIHLYSEIQNAELAERGWYDDFMFLRNNVSFDIPANKAAAEKLTGWVENGYLTPGFEGIGYDDSWQLFLAGEGTMMLTGSWMSGEFVASEIADEIGFFLVPPVEADGYKLSVGGTGLAFAIRKSSPNADLAAEYLNYLYSEETAIALAEAGLLPVYPIDTSVIGGGLLGDIASAWVSATLDDGIGYYMDWVTPTMYDTISASLQELMAGKISADEFVAKINGDYSGFLSSK